MDEIINNLYATSLVTTSINIPNEIGINILSTEDNTLVNDKNFKIIQDDNGVNSIIEFDIIPYIDFSKYDNDRRMFYQIDKYDSIWRLYLPGDYIIEIDEINPIYSHYKHSYYYSMENIFKKKYPTRLKSGYGTTEEERQDLEDLQLTQYKPIRISVLGQELEDVTDYSFNVVSTLNFVNSNINKQFYLKGNKIYSNIDFLFYNIQDINITYYSTIDNLIVTCIMDTNASNYSNYTPIVDYYILKLTGQSF